MLNLLKEITLFLKNDKTRILIRFFCVLLIAWQIVKLASIEYKGFIPTDIFNLFDFLAIPSIYLFSLFIVRAITFLLNIFYNKSTDKTLYDNFFLKKIEYFLATLICVFVMFWSIPFSRLFSIFGLIFFIIVDFVSEYSKNHKKSKKIA